MEARLQKRIQRYGWDRASEQYAHYWQTQLEPVQTRLLELADLQAGEKVLDVACGDGLVSFRAREAVGPEGTVTGDDISKDTPCRFLAARKRAGKLRFVRRDAEAPVGAERSFDAALCSLGLMYVPEPEQALRAMFEALRPGGGGGVGAEWAVRLGRGLSDHRCKSEVGSLPVVFRLGTGTALETDFQATGFTGVTSERLCLQSDILIIRACLRRGDDRQHGRARLCSLRYRNPGCGARRISGVDRRLSCGRGL